MFIEFFVKCLCFIQVDSLRMDTMANKRFQRTASTTRFLCYSLALKH